MYYISDKATACGGCDEKIFSVLLTGVLGFSVCYATNNNKYKNDGELLPHDIRIFTSYHDVRALSYEECLLKCHNNVSYTIEEGHTVTISFNKDGHIIIIADDGGKIKARLHYTKPTFDVFLQTYVVEDLYDEGYNLAINAKGMIGNGITTAPPTFDLLGNGHKDLALYAGRHNTVDRFLLVRCKIPTKNWFFARYTGQFKIDDDANSKLIYTCVMPDTK